MERSEYQAYHIQNNMFGRGKSIKNIIYEICFWHWNGQQLKNIICNWKIEYRNIMYRIRVLHRSCQTYQENHMKNNIFAMELLK